MSSPDRLSPHMTDPESLADILLDQSGELVERSGASRAQTWHRLRRSAIGPATPPPPLLAGGLPLSLAAIAVAATVTALVFVYRSPPRLAVDATPTAAALSTSARPTAAPTPTTEAWREMDVPRAGLLFAAPGAMLRLPEPTPTAGDSDYVVNLDRGELCVQVAHRDPVTQGHFVVRTTELRAVAIGTRFCVNAGTTPAESWVAVEEGRVRVDRMGLSSVVAGPGDLVRADSPKGPEDRVPPQLSAHPRSAAGPAGRRETSRCLAAPSPGGERSCLWQEAGGEDLAAQNALYLLGALTRDQEHDGRAALSIWQTYLHRFPRGALTGETTWAIFDELVSEKRYEEALSATDAFAQPSPGSPQSGQIALRRGDLLADALHRPLEAQRVYRDILASETGPLLRDEALFKLGVCLEELGETAEARATFQRYETEFPQGRHALEVVQRLDPLQRTRQ